MGLLSHLLIVIAFKTYSYSKSASTYALMNDLLANSSADIRPGFGDDYDFVNISFYLRALTELNEVNGYMSTAGVFEVSWIDDRITWDPEDYEGISYISFSSKKVWIPKLIITNPADRIYTFHEFDSDVWYTYEGEAFWWSSSVMKTLCNIAIPAYPFDVHSCYIEVAPLARLSELHLNLPYDTVDTELYIYNVEWAITDTFCSVEVNNPNEPYPYVSFGIHFRRKPIFLVINILVPVILLSVLNAAVFLLPQESGERVSFSITVLLSFAVFLNVISNHIPKTSSPMPLVCYYVLITLISSGFITFLTILGQRLYNSEDQETVPRWFLKCLCMASSHRPNTINGIQSDDENLDNKLKDNFTETESIRTWKEIIIKLDKILFVFFFLTGVFVAFGFIFVMSNME